LADGSDKPHFHGHRQRLRERLLDAGAEGFPDYELLEFLLFSALPRQDTKPLAKALIARFGSFADAVGADREALLGVPGIGEAAVATLLAVREAARRLVRAELHERPVIASWEKLVDYCTATMAYAAVEEFRLLFLDRRNVLIADERQQRGTIDQAPVYVREVVKRALELGASAIIMVHNHPSGDPTPSRSDIEITKQVAQAAAPLGVRLHDHIVIGRSGHTSLRTMGLL
jgi:DNA repair protein RadC